ncbi:MAG: hypothetical protein ACYC6W_12460 [Nitrosotalea sp.]
MKNNIPILDDMWKFIERILIPYGLMPRKTDLSDEQVIKLYSELVSIDMLFRELEQVAILQKEVDIMKK